jgi:hypothetical protein
MQAEVVATVRNDEDHFKHWSSPLQQEMPVPLSNPVRHVPFTEFGYDGTRIVGKWMPGRETINND